MNGKEFFYAVVRMREKQREYLRTRSSSDLAESRMLEKDVDDEIDRVRRILRDRQNPKLWKD